MAATPESMATRTLYEILGISQSASGDEIKTAYRKLAKEFHPDRNPDPGAAKAFNEVKLAYDTLQNASQRKHYDEILREKSFPEYAEKSSSSSKGQETCPLPKRQILDVQPVVVPASGEYALLINAEVLPENVQSFLNGRIVHPDRPKDRRYVDHRFNVVIGGDSGKSALYERIVHGRFTESFLSPMVNQQGTVSRSFGDDCVTQNLFDPTQNRRTDEWMNYQKIYAKCDHAILCVNLDSPVAIADAILNIQEAIQRFGVNNVMIAFTHSDKNKIHTTAMLDTFCKAYGVVGVVTSAKENTGVELLLSVMDTRLIASRITARLATEACTSSSSGGSRFFGVVGKVQDPHVLENRLMKAVEELDQLITDQKSSPADKVFAEKVKMQITGSEIQDFTFLETVRLNNPFSRFGSIIRTYQMQDFLRNPAPEYVLDSQKSFLAANQMLLK